jgi:membrane protein DedA with SNARE-associated domain
MNTWLDSLARHGIALLFGVCFVEAIGAPVPAAVALLTSGALIDIGRMQLLPAFGAACTAFLIGDFLYYVGGRYTGWWLLGFLCKMSANPESCILAAAQSFYKRGKIALVFSKFVPGLNTMAPPLAGSMRMHPRDFLLLDAAGIVLYVGLYLGAGYAFSGVLTRVLEFLDVAGSIVTWVLAAGVAGFLVYRFVLAWRSRAYRDIPRAAASEVSGRILDVRSHGYYDQRAERIQGSTRLEPNRLPDAIAELPEAEKIYLYCT